MAVASRSAERARAFADRHGIERAHGSYAAILADPDVDVLYVATPHPQHHAVALAALRAGKALLVEKAFTATAAGRRGGRRRWRGETGVFVMEAMWTRFQPAVVALRELVADGAIGEVRVGAGRPRRRARSTTRPTGCSTWRWAAARCSTSASTWSRFAQMLLGTPERVVATGSLFPSGADAEAALLLDYADGRSATLTTSLKYALPGQARVFGTTGWIDVLPRFHHPQTIVLHRAGAEPETITRPQLRRRVRRTS